MKSTKLFGWGVAFWILCGIISYFDGVPNGFQNFLANSTVALFVMGIVFVFVSFVISRD